MRARTTMTVSDDSDDEDGDCVMIDSAEPKPEPASKLGDAKKRALSRWEPEFACSLVARRGDFHFVTDIEPERDDKCDTVAIIRKKLSDEVSKWRTKPTPEESDA